MEDENLAYSATGWEHEDVPAYSGVGGYERQRVREFTGGRTGVESDPGSEGSGSEERGDKEVWNCQCCRHDILRTHHLGPSEAFETAEDVILNCVGQTVEE